MALKTVPSTAAASQSRVDVEELKAGDDNNILDSAGEESTGKSSNLKRVGKDAATDDGDNDSDSDEVEPAEPADGEVEGDDEAEGEAEGEGDGEETPEALRARIADEHGLDLDNPKHKAILDAAMAELEAGAGDGDDDDGLTDLEKEIRDGKSKPPAEEKPVVKVDGDKKPTPAPADSNKPTPFDPESHYLREVELLNEAFAEGVKPEQRKRILREFHAHRQDEVADMLTEFVTHPSFLAYMEDKLIAPIKPKIQSFDAVATAASANRSRQEAVKGAIVQLSKRDASYTEFTTRPSAGQPSAYEEVLGKHKWLSRITLDPEYSTLPASQKAVMLEIERLRAAKELAGKAGSKPNKTKSQADKTRAVARILSKGGKIANAAAVKASVQSALNRGKSGAGGGGGNSSGKSGTGNAYMDQMVGAHKKERAGGLFGNS